MAKRYVPKEYQNVEEAIREAIKVGMPVIHRTNTVNDFYLIVGEKIDVEENSELAEMLKANNKKVLVKVPTWILGGMN